jgi:hypothetical protein
MYAVAVRWSEHYFVEPRRTSQAGAAVVESTERRGTFGLAPATIAPAVRMERDSRAAAHQRAAQSAPTSSRRAPFGLQLALPSTPAFAGAPA